MFLISSWSLYQVQSYLPLSIINYGISKHYAGSQMSDRRPLDYLFNFPSSVRSQGPNDKFISESGGAGVRDPPWEITRGHRLPYKYWYGPLREPIEPPGSICVSRKVCTTLCEIL